MVVTKRQVAMPELLLCMPWSSPVERRCSSTCSKVWYLVIRSFYPRGSIPRYPFSRWSKTPALGWESNRNSPDLQSGGISTLPTALSSGYHEEKNMFRNSYRRLTRRCMSCGVFIVVTSFWQDHSFWVTPQNEACQARTQSREVYSYVY